MNIEDVKVGMKVKIANNISRSFRQFGSNDKMYNMKGKIYRVNKVNHNREGVTINNYMWDINDIEPITLTPVKKIEPQLFDPTQLDI